MVKSVFRYIYFLSSYKHLQVPCLPLHKVLNVGPLLCQASVQSIHPIVHNPDKIDILYFKYFIPAETRRMKLVLCSRVELYTLLV